MTGSWQSAKQHNDAYFHDWMKRGITPCLTVSLFHEHDEIYAYVDGLTRTGGEPIDAKTPFNIGSVSKPITAALIVKLAEMGKLSLHDKVSKYIAACRSPSVSLLHLMTHTGGYTQVPPWSRPQEHEMADFRNKLYALEPDEAPSLRASYFSFGYTILMDVVQAVAGQPIEQFAREHLFDPLDMRDTTYDMSGLPPGAYTLPCRLDSSAGVWEWDPASDRLAVTADSGVYSTAGDLTKFAGMLLCGGVRKGRRVFSGMSARLMLQESTGRRFAKTPAFWMKTEVDGYGCFGDLNSPQAVGHPGFSGCMLFIDPAYRAAGSIVTNSQQLYADSLNFGKMINRLLASLP